MTNYNVVGIGLESSSCRELVIGGIGGDLTPGQRSVIMSQSMRIPTIRSHHDIVLQLCVGVNVSMQLHLSKTADESDDELTTIEYQ